MAGATKRLPKGPEKPQNELRALAVKRSRPYGGTDGERWMPMVVDAACRPVKTCPTGYADRWLAQAVADAMLAEAVQ